MGPLCWLSIGAGILLSLWAQFRVKSAYARYSQVASRSGLTGADVAKRILEANGISGVSVEGIQGSLTDHYDPRTRTLRLSEGVYGARSIAAAGIFADEVGHAIQHARHYGPLRFRSAWVPVANLGGVRLVAADAGLLADQAGRRRRQPRAQVTARTDLDRSALSTPAADPIAHPRRRAEQGLRPGGFGILVTRQIVGEMHDSAEPKLSGSSGWRDAEPHYLSVLSCSAAAWRSVTQKYSLSSKTNFVTPPVVDTVTAMGTMPSNVAVALVALRHVSVTTLSGKCSTVFTDAPGSAPSTVHLYR